MPSSMASAGLAAACLAAACLAAPSSAASPFAPFQPDAGGSFIKLIQPACHWSFKDAEADVYKTMDVKLIKDQVIIEVTHDAAVPNADSGFLYMYGGKRDMIGFNAFSTWSMSRDNDANGHFEEVVILQQRVAKSTRDGLTVLRFDVPLSAFEGDLYGKQAWVYSMGIKARLPRSGKFTLAREACRTPAATTTTTITTATAKDYSCASAGHPQIRTIAVENTHRVATGHQNKVYLSGTWPGDIRYTKVSCGWWYKGRTYMPYHTGRMVGYGVISCDVPDRTTPAHIDRSAAPPAGAEVQVTVSVWDTRSTDRKDSAAHGKCMSHFGAPVPNDSTAGRYANFKYGVPRTKGRCSGGGRGQADNKVCARYAHGICGKPNFVTGQPYSHLCSWVDAGSTSNDGGDGKARDCKACIKEFHADGGCAAWRRGENVRKLVPQGCDHCSAEAQKFCGVQDEKPLMCSSVGDPHFNTFAGRRFDFYGLGLYWLANTTGVAVQALHTPAGRASANAGVAMLDRASGEVVTLRATTAGALDVVLPSGVAAASAGVTRFCGGACSLDTSVARDRATWMHKSGLTVRVQTFGNGWMNIYVLASSRLKGDISGLCGDMRHTHPAGPDAVDTAPVIEADSVYAFPAGYVAPGSNGNGNDGEGDACAQTPGLLQEAEHACQEAGDMAEECIKDVCATGDMQAVTVIGAAVEEIAELDVADIADITPASTAAPATTSAPCDPDAIAAKQQALLDALQSTAQGVASSVKGMVEQLKDLDIEADELEKQLAALDAALDAKGC